VDELEGVQQADVPAALLVPVAEDLEEAGADALAGLLEPRYGGSGTTA